MLRRLHFSKKVEAMKILFKDAKSQHTADTVSKNVLTKTPHDKESVSVHFNQSFVSDQGELAFTHLRLSISASNMQ